MSGLTHDRDLKESAGAVCAAIVAAILLFVLAYCFGGKA
jgi:hypothetical protein